MATPFPCTIRSLDLDRADSEVARIGLLVAILLCFLWGLWFLTAPVLSYQVTRAVSVTQEEDTIVRTPQEGGGAIRPQLFRRRGILATFPTEATQNIQLGQAAFLRLAGAGQARGAIPAVVAEIKPSTTPGKITVKLYTLQEGNHPYPFTGNELGEVTIERPSDIPIGLVFRALGVSTETPPVSLSPAPHTPP